MRRIGAFNTVETSLRCTRNEFVKISHSCLLMKSIALRL
ncbi:hypothetical protein EKH55_0300 [Sinorhizobium alkalisoli]|nr:hypothetical protein EKH55_0300 [Sinorhizobium alkalisoli]